MTSSARAPADSALDPGEARRLVHGWALRFLRHHHDALDVTQAVLMKSLAGTFPDGGRHIAWLRTATHHACVDLIRRRRPIPPRAR